MNPKIIGDPLQNLPWQPRPESAAEAVWRFSENPIIRRDAIASSNSIFNSAVVPTNGSFAGVFRCDNRRREMRLHRGFSDDGLNWRIDSEPIVWNVPPGVEKPAFAYDPRCCWIEDRFYITWCNGFHGPAIGIGYTNDFVSFHMIENVLLPCNRNGVLFPRKINGSYVMLSRPSDNGHTPFGEIFLSHSPDMIHWGRHRHVMAPEQPWESTKIGAGPTPIETTEGWLIFHHGVLTSCNGFVYHFGAALLDLDQPERVIARTQEYLLSPQTNYECVGDVPNVVFPCAALTDADTGRIAIYYGAADTVTCLAFTTLENVLTAMGR
jgi:beta-1,4-mannooligosaccharide/beta-1,4-mannosyl-N-acetylglucosamine phosphorylase